ncbi:MAG: hypothetical protein LBI63_03875 [Candidatus Ancillula sp.]|nr:hypothetical protein [Candidatus Ancillula sp.]
MLILVNLGKLVSSGIHALTANGKQQTTDVVSNTPTASAPETDIPDNTVVPNCNTNDLSVQVDTDKSSFTQQEGLRLLVKTTYLGQKRCSVKTSTDNRILLIRFDNKDFYNSQNCAVDDLGVILTKGEVSTQEVTWNMHANGADSCSSGDLAIPGYYTAQLIFASPSGLTSNSITFRVV